MKALSLPAVLCLSLLVNKAVAVEATDWRVVESKDQFTDVIDNYYATKTSTDYKARLGIACQMRNKEIFFSYAHLGQKFLTQNYPFILKYRIDSQQPVQFAAKFDDDGDTLYFRGDDDINAFIANLHDNSTVVVAAVPQDNLVATFDMAGAKKGLTEVMTKCGR
jgi:hypothetical protein